MRLLLGLGNKARHGKDSAGAAIKQYFDTMRGVSSAHGLTSRVPEVRILRFAEALYQECRTVHGMVGKDAVLLQRVGLARRLENDRHWLDKMFFNLGNFDGIGIIVDVRYQNEAVEIVKRGGFLINVTRVNGDGTNFVAPDRPADHVSETDLDGYAWDAYIKTQTGQEALAAEFAITTANFFYQLGAR